MSYILDALRRADAERERERGAVPGLHARTIPMGVPEPVAAPARPAWLVPALVLTAVALLALAVWAGLRGRPPVAAGAAPASAAALPAPTPAPVTPVAPAIASPPPAPLVQIVPVPVPVPAPAATAPNAAPTRPDVVQEAAPPRAIALAQLPPDLRREWPQLVAGGSVYSDSPASRFVILNGQVVREGESPAPGVTLERIGPKTAIFRWRDKRIELPL